MANPNHQHNNSGHYQSYNDFDSNPYFNPYLRSATPPYAHYRNNSYSSSTPMTSVFDVSRPSASTANLLDPSQQHLSHFQQPYRDLPEQPALAPPTPSFYGHQRTPLRPATPAPPINFDYEEPGPGPIIYADKPLPKRQNRKGWFICLGIAAVAVVVVIIIAVVVSVQARKTSNTGGGSGSGSASPQQHVLVQGTDGSTVTDDLGNTWTYNNTFGGYWYFDPANPFVGGKPNSWTPAINETWNWGTDTIRGVNLGGWLVLEPFISPGIFQKYSAQNVIDEWGLETAMAADTSPGGGTGQLEDHYKTFITEQDFAQIAGAGLNWVRIPIPYWAIEVYPGEPFVPKVAWTYFLKGIQWARKYGLRINVDLHTIPGSENGWNHSGKTGSINFLRSVMGVANAQRTLSYIDIIAQFISQPQYSDVIQIFGIVNEPWDIGNPVLSDFYYEAYQTVRKVTGFGKGPVISMFSASFDGSTFTDFLPGADRIALDVHPYFAFGPPSQAFPQAYAEAPCKSYAVFMNATWNKFGIATAGEFSLAVNDCGLYVEHGGPPAYEATFGNGSCAPWVAYTHWTPAVITGLKNLFLTQTDSLNDWFYWTWKIGPSAISGAIEAPWWSYQLGLQQGWIPADPRSGKGSCASMGVPQGIPRTVVLSPQQTGGATTDAIPAAATATLAWPPPALADQPNAALLPTYTPTGTPITLPVPTFTNPATPSATIDAGTGYFNQAVNDPMYVPIQGCTYPNAWNAGEVVPAACPSR